MSEYAIMIHEPASVHHTVLIGDGSVIWPFTTILAGTQIGKQCTIGARCFLGARCVLGDGVVMHSGAQLPSHACVGAYTMIGPNAVLTDCLYPNLEAKDQEVHRAPVIEDHVILGANCTILPGVIIGHHAIVGAGSVVTRDVAPGTVVAGNPARVLRRAPLTSYRSALLGDEELKQAVPLEELPYG